MCGFGDRLPYSVFECRFSRRPRALPARPSARLIHHREDQVLFVDLGPAAGRGRRVITSRSKMMQGASMAE
jgi:CRISPR-associated protein Cas2